MQEMRNLVAYWILFSLISLFELAFGTLIQWLPFWPYIKLMTICWLVLPRFDGACYVYEHLIHRWLSVDPKELINLIIKPKKSTSLDAERFLSMADKFVKEKGSEALEKLIAGKSEHSNPDFNTEEIKGVTNTEENGLSIIGCGTVALLKVPNAVQDDTKAVELTSKNPDAAIERSPPKVPHVAMENAKIGDLKEKDLAATERVKTRPILKYKPKMPNVAMENAKAGDVMEKDLAAAERNHPKEPAVAKENAKAEEVKETDIAATERVKYVEPGLAQTGKKTVAAGEIKEKLVMEELGPEKVQREWTCAVCQVRTTCEKNLNSHLQGKMHKAKCEALNASKNKSGPSSTTSGCVQKRPNSGNNPKKQEDNKVQVMQVSQQQLKQNRYELWCGICNVSCTSRIDMESHLRGQKHLFQIQALVPDSRHIGF